MKSTECLETKKQIDLFLDNLVEPLERQKIERHLAQCDECSKEVELIRAFELNAAKMKKTPLSSSLKSGIMGAIKAELAKNSPQSVQENILSRLLKTWKSFWEPVNLRRWNMFCGCAGLAVVILLLFHVFTFSPPSLKTDESFFSVSIKSAKGAPQLIRSGKTMKLDDDSHEITAKIQHGDTIVTAGECESKIRFPGLVAMSIFSDTEVECKRNEFLLRHGKASMVFQKLERPFFIKTPHIEVEIVGTGLGFDVRADRTIMYLVSGVVKIKEIGKEKIIRVMQASKVAAGEGRDLKVSLIQPTQEIKGLLKIEKTDVKANDDRSW